MAGIEQRTYADLSRCMSHALRHEPWLCELELDDEGWTPLEQLLSALRVQRPTWSSLQVCDLESVIESSSKN